jgi:hypothetical protein
MTGETSDSTINQSPLSSSGLTGRSSIPEAPVLKAEKPRRTGSPGQAGRRRGDARPHSRGAIRPRFASTPALVNKQEGAGKAGCALHPRSRVQTCTKHAHEHTGEAEASGLPCAVVYGLLRDLLGDRAFLPPSLRGYRARSNWIDAQQRNLTPASGCRDHTTSPYARLAFVFRKLRVHRISPRVRDDREPPLSSGETGGFKSLICPTRQQEFFPLMGLTDFWVICPSCCFVARGSRDCACVGGGEAGFTVGGAREFPSRRPDS